MDLTLTAFAMLGTAMMADYGILLPRHPDGSEVRGKLLWAVLRRMGEVWFQYRGATLAKREAAVEDAGNKVVRGLK